jgi:hypothetical protein
MNRDDIIKLALEAGFCKDSNGIYSRRAVTPDSDLLPSLERFAALVAAAEREACAKACDGWMHANGNDCAAAIRARGEV